MAPVENIKSRDESRALSELGMITEKTSRDKQGQVPKISGRSPVLPPFFPIPRTLNSGLVTFPELRTGP